MESGLYTISSPMSSLQSAAFLCLLSCTGLFLTTSPARAQSPELDFFQKSVRPILEEHCFDCHGPEKQKNKLRFDNTVGILKGGESGEPLLLPGHSADSYLFKRVNSTNPKDMMPPKGERLGEAQVQTLRQWIDAGALLPQAVACGNESWVYVAKL